MTTIAICRRAWWLSVLATVGWICAGVAWVVVERVGWWWSAWGGGCDDDNKGEHDERNQHGAQDACPARS